MHTRIQIQIPNVRFSSEVVKKYIICLQITELILTLFLVRFKQWRTSWLICSQDALSWSYYPLSNLLQLFLLLGCQCGELVSHGGWKKETSVTFGAGPGDRPALAYSLWPSILCTEVDFC